MPSKIHKAAWLTRGAGILAKRGKYALTSGESR